MAASALPETTITCSGRSTASRASNVSSSAASPSTGITTAMPTDAVTPRRPRPAAPTRPRGARSGLALRGAQFADLSTRGGGTLAGMPVVISSGITHDTSGGSLGIVDAAAIVVAAGDAGVDVSREAAVEMNSTPTSPPTAATVLISLWQHNMTGVKVERFLNWAKARADAAALVTGADYSSGS